MAELAPLSTSEEGSFAQFTFRERMPDMVQRVISSNQELGRLDSRALERLENLKKSLVDNEPVPKPAFAIQPEHTRWLEAWAALPGEKRWLDGPWFVLEALLYRLVLECTSYYDQHAPMYSMEPFEPQKSAAISSSATWASMLSCLGEIESCLEHDDERAAFMAAVDGSTWANQLDLSYQSVAAAASRRLLAAQTASPSLAAAATAAAAGASSAADAELRPRAAQLLVDDADALFDWIVKVKPFQISIICDNAGAEFCQDLILADLLLTGEYAQQVFLHFKGSPTFVSDVTQRDVELTFQMINDRIHHSTQVVRYRRNSIPEIDEDAYLAAEAAAAAAEAAKAAAGDSGDAGLSPNDGSGGSTVANENGASEADGAGNEPADSEEPADPAAAAAALESQIVSHEHWITFAQELYGRLAKFLESGALVLQPDAFWNGHEFFDQIPAHIGDQLQGRDLIFVKGDANYRRVVRDTRHDVTAPFAPFVRECFPDHCGVVCLRTLKSDPVVGLAEGVEEMLSAQDAKWRVNGKRAVIQFAPPAPTPSLA